MRTQDCDPPRFTYVSGSGGTNYKEMWNRTQRSEVLDRLVCRSILTQSDRVVREDVNDLHFRECGQAYCGSHVIGKCQKRSAKWNQPATQRDSYQCRTHRVFAHSKMQNSSVVGASSKTMAALDVGVVRNSEIGRATN